MFRERQRLRVGASTQVLDKELVKDEKTGYCAEHFVDACRVLPDPQNFDLGTLVEAGVPLKQVDTTLIDTRPIDVTQFESVEDLESSKSSKSSEPSEPSSIPNKE